jgi:DNA recombination protein Rad52
MFSEQQLKQLAAKLSERFVKTREQGGKKLSYVEGWHVIAEANRIFGFDGWDRETVLAECIWQDAKRDPKLCAYAARVRIRVRAGETSICREGSGVGHGTGATLGEAHESALKEAETDAMKRALSTFGNQFGLALYDKEQNGVRRRPNRHGSIAAGIWWTLLSGTGARLSRHDLPEQFCGALRELLENTPTVQRLERIWARNAGTVEHLRKAWPQLKTVNGTHYADLLTRLYEQSMERLKSATSAAVPANGASTLQQSELTLAMPKRLRDPEHLRYVASLPCIVCARTPSQAHHLRFAQPRSLGSKVSDEWTVPLCFIHHRALHDAGDEELWWQVHGINAKAEAERLWRTTHQDQVSVPAMINGPNQALAAAKAGAIAVEDGRSEAEATLAQTEVSA